MDMVFCKDCVHYDKVDHDPAEYSRCLHRTSWDMVTGEIVAPTCAKCRDTHTVHELYQCGPNARFFLKKI